MRECYIYVIGREDGPVKVGITSSPRERLHTLQTACPFKIDLLHYRACADRDDALWREQMFHDVYDDNRLHGEWFDIEADLAIEGVDLQFELDEYYAEMEAAGG